MWAGRMEGFSHTAPMFAHFAYPCILYKKSAECVKGYWYQGTNNSYRKLPACLSRPCGVFWRGHLLMPLGHKQIGAVNSRGIIIALPHLNGVAGWPLEEIEGAFSRPILVLVYKRGPNGLAFATPTLPLQ